VTEFELIERYFARAVPPGGLVRQGVGDDCALLDSGERQLAITTDMLLEGRHFLPATDPESLGHKALAVNLSDLAAAGATPRAFLLALALPRADQAWLAAFSRGLFATADRHGCVLAGGDTTRVPRIDVSQRAPVDGPLTICITALGDLPRSAMRTRAGARAGDDLWVSGTLGDARAALAVRAGELAAMPADAAYFAAKMDRPEPRVALGIALRGIATAAIDVSDGLLGDLAHIMQRSRVGATVQWDQVPRSPALCRLPEAMQQQFALAGGDDYELLFTAVPARRAEVEAAAAAAKVPVARIGRIDSGNALRIVDAGGHSVSAPWHSFDHFGSPA
jgi:thiamine-monophosphate kinase